MAKVSTATAAVCGTLAGSSRRRPHQRR